MPNLLHGGLIPIFLEDITVCRLFGLHGPNRRGPRGPRVV